VDALPRPCATAAKAGCVERCALVQVLEKNFSVRGNFFAFFVLRVPKPDEIRFRLCYWKHLKTDENRAAFVVSYRC